MQIGSAAFGLRCPWESHSPEVSRLLEALLVPGEDHAVTHPAACAAAQVSGVAALRRGTAALRPFSSLPYACNSPVCVLYLPSVPEPGAGSLFRLQLKWQTAIFHVLELWNPQQMTGRSSRAGGRGGVCYEALWENRAAFRNSFAIR